MKALAWGANFVLIVAVGLALQGCGYQFVKKDLIQNKDDEIVGLQENNRTASANLRVQLDKVKALEGDLAERNDAVAALRKQMANLEEALKVKKATEETVDNLTAQLKGQLAGTGVIVKGVPMGTVLAVEGDVLFSSGKVDLKEEAKKTLDKVADAIKNENREIVVSGFTDSDPIVHSPWKTNMRLSGERAMVVMDYLAEKGVPAERMHYAGYGEFKTMKDESGAESKKASRRVEILLMTPEATAEEAPAAPAAPAEPKKGPPEK